MKLGQFGFLVVEEVRSIAREISIFSPSISKIEKIQSLKIYFERPKLSR